MSDKKKREECTLRYILGKIKNRSKSISKHFLALKKERGEVGTSCVDIIPQVVLFKILFFKVWENLQYLLTIPGEDGGGFWTLLNELFEYYESDPDILAKLFRITANVIYFGFCFIY